MHAGVLARLGLVCVPFLGGRDVMDGFWQVRDQPKEPEVEEQRSAEQLLVEARDWQCMAALVDGEWRVVGTLMEQAGQAAAKGD